MIRTVLVDDSVSFRALVTALLEEAGGFTIVGVAGDGARALELVQKLRPDLVVMDVVMAGMDGLSATAEIMERAPCPVVVVSSLLDSRAQQVAFDALQAGAVDVLAKPRDATAPDVRRRFVEALRAMAQVKVVRRRSTGSTLSAPTRLVAIGASTGGPPALAELLRRLPGGFKAPIVIAQHLASGFTEGLARWLREASSLKVEVVAESAALLPGRVYLPRDGCHVEIAPGVVRAIAAPPDETPVPKVDRLFRSCLSVGPGVVGVLLTGMGADGAQGLLELKHSGHLTLGQDEATSLVYGMPRVARELGAVCEELSLDAMGPRLAELAR